MKPKLKRPLEDLDTTITHTNEHTTNTQHTTHTNLMLARRWWPQARATPPCGFGAWRTALPCAHFRATAPACCASPSWPEACRCHLHLQACAASTLHHTPFAVRARLEKPGCTRCQMPATAVGLECHLPRVCMSSCTWQVAQDSLLSASSRKHPADSCINHATLAVGAAGQHGGRCPDEAVEREDLRVHGHL